MRERGFGLWTWASRRGRPCDGNHLFLLCRHRPRRNRLLAGKASLCAANGPMEEERKFIKHEGMSKCCKTTFIYFENGEGATKVSLHLFRMKKHKKNCPCIYFEWRATNPPYIYQFRMTTHKILLNICFNEEPQNSPYIYFEWRTTKNYLKEYSKTI